MIELILGSLLCLLCGKLAYDFFVRGNSRRGRSVPPPDSDILSLSATEMARLVRERRITSTQLVQLHIDRIESTRTFLNAVVRDRFQEALEEAHEKDKLLPTLTTLPPFFGVPCSIKESVMVKGMPHTSGLHGRREVVSAEDASTVTLMKKAGFIILGVTNTSELCMWWESNNKVYGRTNNPYDEGCIVGGSSGGEGCIVSACGSPVGLGSDIGGSIRMPAFFNGVFGHKPSPRLVSNDGQHPCAENDALNYQCTGPITRHAEDLFPLLAILAGPAHSLTSPDTVDFKQLHVLDATQASFGPAFLIPRVNADLVRAQARVIAFFQREGLPVTSFAPHSLRASLAMWSAALGAAGGRTFREQLDEQRATPLVPIRELLAMPFRHSHHTLPAVMLALIETLVGKNKERQGRLLAKRDRLKALVVEALGANGIMLLPSHPTPAPRHGAPLRRPLSFVYTAIVNILELPATQVPLGLSPMGLPMGIQVVAGPGCDHVCIAVAKRLAAEFGGWTEPWKRTE